MKDVKVDPEFRALIFPLAEAELSGLEESLLAEGCRDALVTWHGLLLDGHHRLEICRKHGIEFRTAEVELEDRTAAKVWVIRNQFARRNLTPFQRVELILKLEPLIAARAKGHLRTPTGGRGKLTLPISAESIDTREELASAAGVSHDTISKAKALLSRAAPTVLEKLRHGDATIAREHRILTMTERHYELGKKKLTFPRGKFAVIYADPPWHGSDGFLSDNRVKMENRYPTMPTEEICLMAGSIDGVTTEETILFLWAVASLLPEALQVMAAWGFKYRTHLIWDKGRAMAIGWFIWPRHELLLIGVKSKTPHPNPKGRSESIFSAPRRGHSEKPEEAYVIIEKMYAGPYLELFARGQARAEWAAYGNEVEAFSEASGDPGPVEVES